MTGRASANRQPSKRAPGRPRSEKARKAILLSAFRLLRERGFEGVSMQEIAAAAGVSTATLYRWWDNKHAILLDAYLERTRDLLPSQGELTPIERLREYTKRIAVFLRRQNGRVFLRLLMAIQEDDALYSAFYERVYRPRHAEGCAVVQAAIDAGELPETVDPQLLIRLLIGPQVLSALLGLEVSTNSAERIFDSVVQAQQKAGPPCRPG